MSTSIYQRFYVGNNFPIKENKEIFSFKWWLFPSNICIVTSFDSILVDLKKEYKKISTLKFPWISLFFHLAKSIDKLSAVDMGSNIDGKYKKNIPRNEYGSHSNAYSSNKPLLLCKEDGK